MSPVVAVVWDWTDTVNAVTRATGRIRREGSSFWAETNILDTIPYLPVVNIGSRLAMPEPPRIRASMKRLEESELS